MMEEKDYYADLNHFITHPSQYKLVLKMDEIEVMEKAIKIESAYQKAAMLRIRANDIVVSIAERYYHHNPMMINGALILNAVNPKSDITLLSDYIKAYNNTIYVYRYNPTLDAYDKLVKAYAVEDKDIIYFVIEKSNISIDKYQEGHTVLIKALEEDGLVVSKGKFKIVNVVEETQHSIKIGVTPMAMSKGKFSFYTFTAFLEEIPSIDIIYK